MHPGDHYYNWVYNSSCPELQLSYEFNKRNYSLDLTLKQTSAVEYGQTEHQNMSDKLDTIFNSSSVETELTRPL